MVDIEYIKRLERENLHIENGARVDVPMLTEEQIDSKYLKGEVRIITEQARYPLETIKNLVDSGRYILRPDFQRRHRWDVVKQSRLIESFIINIPIPPIFLYERDFSVYEVMDGLQRITAIKDFYEDSYALAGLNEWPELNGMRYSQLPLQVKRGIDRRYLSSIILLKETAKEESDAEKMKQMVFERINSGGAKLEYQESRNALYPSKLNEMVIKLARNPYFCEIFDIPQATDDEDISNDIYSEELKNNSQFQSMKDAENVLRFFAMRQLESWGDISLSKFLDRFADEAKNLPDEIIPFYQELFEETIELAYRLFGDHAFCLWKFEKRMDDYRWNKKPNLVVYDPMMYVLSNLLDHKGELLRNIDSINNAIKSLFAEYQGMFNGRNTSRSYVAERIELFTGFFNSFLR